jgi:hypothetical protein
MSRGDLPGRVTCHQVRFRSQPAQGAGQSYLHREQAGLRVRRLVDQPGQFPARGGRQHLAQRVLEQPAEQAAHLIQRCGEDRAGRCQPGAHPGPL